jgi:hypothetical protein
MPSLHEQTLARTVHRYKMGFAAKAVCQIQVKLYYKIIKATLSDTDEEYHSSNSIFNWKCTSTY